jgi:molybdopterin molybdotransferase
MALSQSAAPRSVEPGAASVDAVQAWIDAAILPLGVEQVRLGESEGRVLVAAARAAGSLPDRNRATLDGFAVEASQTVGAAAYNPVSVAGIAVLVGDAMPADANAVVPLVSAEPANSGDVLVVEPAAAGANVEPEGVVATAGAVMAPAGARLAPRHIGLLAAAGLAQVTVVKRPRVVMLLTGPLRRQGIADSNGPMIVAAVRRDGGVVTERVEVARDCQSLAGALAAADADLTVVIGGTGPGSDDHAAAALSEAGELVFHGMALRPGETAGLGRTNSGVPVMLLPGGAAACLWSYEMFAGRALRRLAGRRPDLPFHRYAMTLGRKIVSAIGVTEICPVRFGTRENTIEPLPAFAEIGLMAAAGGDGFIIVPEGSEGHPQGAVVIAYLYEDHQGDRRENGVPR